MKARIHKPWHRTASGTMKCQLTNGVWLEVKKDIRGRFWYGPLDDEGNRHAWSHESTEEAAMQAAAA